MGVIAPTFNLSSQQGFKYAKTATDPVGYVTKLKIGDKQLTANQNVPKIDEDGNQDVVGVMTSFHWNTGTTDPFTIDMLVSSTVAGELAELMEGGMKKIDVEAEFYVLMYDTESKVYWKRYLADTALLGIIQKNGDVLAVNKPGSPESNTGAGHVVYAFGLTFTYQPKEQDVKSATKPLANQVLKWGVGVA